MQLTDNGVSCPNIKTDGLVDTGNPRAAKVGAVDERDRVERGQDGQESEIYLAANTRQDAVSLGAQDFRASRTTYMSFFSTASMAASGSAGGVPPIFSVKESSTCAHSAPFASSMLDMLSVDDAN